MVAPSHNRVSVQTIAVLKFSGILKDWMHLHDLFVALIGENATVTAVEKMYHLKVCLESNTTHLMAIFKITADLFALLWDAVVQCYKIKRLLILEQLHKMFSVWHADNHSSKQRIIFLSTGKEAANTLKALGSPIDKLDKILVHLIVQKFDFTLREAWEVELGTFTDSPTDDHIGKFLIESSRACEAIECGVSPKNSKTDSIKDAKTKATSTNMHFSQAASASNPQLHLLQSQETSSWVQS